MIPSLLSLLPLLPLGAFAALEVNLDDKESIKRAAAQVADDLLAYYDGHDPGHTVGILPGPPPDGAYYWWEAGAMWGTLVDYWHWTGDDKWNKYTYDSLVHQAGPNKDYADKNWSLSLGNDDQGFWGMSAMIAAEFNFQDPPEGQPQWLALAQAVWTEQTAENLRDGGCGIGLRWQTTSLNVGYTYKNTIANGCFFNIGARLARYTGNDTYLDWSVKTWDWLISVKYIDDEYNIYDGADIGNNCTKIDKQQFSYNAGVLLQGCAYMYDYTKDQIWKDRIDGLLEGIERVFFPKGVAYEACEAGVCTTDMYTYKGFLHRWMAYTAKLVPETADKIMPLLRSSTKAAVAQCTGGDNGRQCGFHWSSGKFDGLVGAGQTMNVLAALSSLLALDATAAVTNTTGGTSTGDSNAGGSRITYTDLGPITTGDRAGAGVLTVVAIGIASLSLWWMIK